MKVINLGATNSIVSQYMSQLRDRNYQQNRILFRQNLTRIGHVMAYEISRTLDYAPRTVETPLGSCDVQLPADHIVVGTVLRAGLAFHQGFLDVFDGADSAFVAAYREEGGSVEETAGGSRHADVKIRLEYMAAPHLDGSTFLLVDRMLATGGSLDLAYKAFLGAGCPAKLHICVVIAAQEGVERLKKAFPSDEVTLWTAAIDPELNADAYIVPGLGDAGDLSFGPKISNKE